MMSMLPRGRGAFGLEKLTPYNTLKYLMHYIKIYLSKHTGDWTPTMNKTAKTDRV